MPRFDASMRSHITPPPIFLASGTPYSGGDTEDNRGRRVQSVDLKQDEVRGRTIENDPLSVDFAERGEE